MTWQPIETAPKHDFEKYEQRQGEPFVHHLLLFGPVWFEPEQCLWSPRIYSGHWCPMCNDWVIGGTYDLTDFKGQPTHWMPLPPAPTGDA